MANIKSYTPAWLSKPNPGYTIFTPKPKEAQVSTSYAFNQDKKKAPKPGPRRTIARRGTEVFVAVGKEVRWADLVYLKEAWEDNQSNHSSKGAQKGPRDNQYTQDHAQGHRTLRLPVADDIQQLVMSPKSNYLAVLTRHTVHVAILPESSHLTAPDTSPLRLKTYTLGPTTHVTTQSAIASALWHPLGVDGNCLVTITEDSIVRVWELSTADRWSFDRPTLSIDLKKLSDGTSLDQDFSAAPVGTKKGFSADVCSMEVVSACFANGGSGWSPMTLWVAMREGDIYALCPLLPEKWSPPPTLIPSLSVSIVAKVALLEDDLEASKEAKLLAQQQLAWMGDLDAQEPVLVEGAPGDEPAEVYIRPAKPGKFPKLQGPFDFELAPLDSEDELDTLLTDIYVIGPKFDADEFMEGEEDLLEIDAADEQGLSLGIVCLLTTSGRLSVFLDLDGVEAQWLPKSKSRPSQKSGEEDYPSLLTFQVMDTSKSGEIWAGNWPTFSTDDRSRYSMFITGTGSISFVSLTPWVFKLELEMSGDEAGTEFRIDRLVNGERSIINRVFTQKMEDRSSPLCGSILISDSDLGYFLLTATPYYPIACTLDDPEDNYDPTGSSRSATYEPDFDKPLLLIEPRPVYQPGLELEASSSLPEHHIKLRHGQHKRILGEEIRLSPVVLEVMTDLHKQLSGDTNRIAGAAADLFRRCESLQTELKSQIKKANEVASRVEAISGLDSEDGPIVSMNEAVESRIGNARARNIEINERLDSVRRKVAKGVSRELSDKEKAWVEEVNSVKRKILGGETGTLTQSSSRRTKEVWERYEDVENLKDDFLAQVRDLTLEVENTDTHAVQVPSEVRKAKLAQIKALLDRETALVEGAKSRLERLKESTVDC